MNSISLFSFLLVAMVAHGAPGLGVGNSMMPETHATALVPMITGTNVPESEEEIEAPIEDSREVEKIKNLAHNVAENAKNPEEAPIVGNFIKANPGFMSTVASVKESVESSTRANEPAFTLGGHPTLSTKSSEGAHFTTTSAQ